MTSGRQVSIVSSSLGTATLAFTPAKISRTTMAAASAGGTWRSRAQIGASVSSPG